jgi:hypothetical protein
VTEATLGGEIHFGCHGGGPQSGPRPPITDRAHMGGNHVILACGGVWILLGYLQRDSVLISRGDRIAAGQRVGRVGIPAPRGTAQRRAASIQLNGRYLARNDRVSGHSAKASYSGR